MAIKFDIIKTNIATGDVHEETIEVEKDEMMDNLLPGYMKDTQNNTDIWVYTDNGNRNFFASTNKDRDMSDITKENPICIGYPDHHYTTIYCKDNKIHAEYHFLGYWDMQVAYHSIVESIVKIADEFYPAIRNKYGAIGIAISEVNFTF